VISNLGNPKIAIFFTSFPCRSSRHRGSFLALLVLGLVFA